ncbi:MAG: T9SS type A sorting domain-containing protein, partial [Bacteroidia bacterium]|nr:T9SS type A sorting domain-containing protein [Bacteroidia bacterium]
QNPAVVRFRFDPIFLPDSTTDLEGSNGFVKFGIQMMPGLPLGSTIENKAAIYFDFNAPIITNTVVHTLVEPTVCKNDMTTDSITACEPILWIDGQLYDSSTSVPMFTLQDASGCDSVVNLNFTLAEIDPSVDLVDVTLMALEENAAYQWVDCDDNFKHIAGATSRSYTPPIPDGYFGVIISKNACQDTSECTRLVFILAELLLENDLKIFPNPTDGKFSIELEAAQSIKRIQLYDLYGKKVLDQLVNEKKQVSLVLDIGRGIYLLEVETSNGQRINTKMVKK